MKEVIITDKHEILYRTSLPEEENIEKTEGWYCPEFGMKEKCIVLRTRYEKTSLPHAGGWEIKVED